MKLDELKQLLALLEKAERHAQQQASTPDGAYWLAFWIDLKTARLAVRDFIDTSEGK